MSIDQSSFIYRNQRLLKDIFTSNNSIDQDAITLQQLALRKLEELVQTKQLASIKIPPAASLRRVVLNNGFTVYFQNRVIEGVEQGTVSLRLMVRAGYLSESKKDQDIAHLVEHCIFHGTVNRTEEDIRNFLRDLGGALGADSNATTYWDRTDYRLQNIFTKDLSKVKEALSILYEFACKATFPIKKISEERKMVVNEHLRTSEKQKQRSLHYAENHFPDPTFVSFLPRKLSDSLADCSEEELRKRMMTFYKEWYHPENMALFVVGDFGDEPGKRIREEEIYNYSVELFEAIPCSQKKQVLFSQNPVERCNTRFSEFSDEQQRMPVITLLRELSDKRVAKLEYPFADLLFKLEERLRLRAIKAAIKEIEVLDDSGVVSWRVKSEGLINYGRTSQQELESVFTCYSSFGDEEKAFKNVYLALRRVAAYGVSLKEIKAMLKSESERLITLVKNIHTASHISEVDWLMEKDLILRSFPENGAFSNDEIGHSIILALLIKYYIHFDERHRQLFSSLDPVNKPHQYSIVIRTKKDNNCLEKISQVYKEINKIPLHKLKPFEFENNIEIPFPPRPATHKITSSIEYEKMNCKKVVLSNGVSVIFKKTNDPDQTIHLTFTGNEQGASTVLDQLLLEMGVIIVNEVPVAGLTNRAYIQHLNSKAIQEPEFKCSYNGISVSVKVLNLQALEETIQLFCFRLCDKKVFFSNEFRNKFDKLLKSDKQFIDNSLNNVEYQIQTVLSKFLWDNEFLRALSLEDINQASLEATQKIMINALTHFNNPTLIVCGNYKMEDVENLILDYMGGVPPFSKLPSKDEVIFTLPPPQKVTAFGVDENRFETFLALPFSKSSAEILTNSSAGLLTDFINDKVRFQLQQTYSVQTQVTYPYFNDSLNYYILKIITDEQSQEIVATSVMNVLKECSRWVESDIEQLVQQRLLSHKKYFNQQGYLTSRWITSLKEDVKKNRSLEENTHCYEAYEQYSISDWLNCIKSILSGLDQRKELIIAPKSKNI